MLPSELSVPPPVHKPYQAQKDRVFRSPLVGSWKPWFAGSLESVATRLELPFPRSTPAAYLSENLPIRPCRVCCELSNLWKKFIEGPALVASSLSCNSCALLCALLKTFWPRRLDEYWDNRHFSVTINTLAEYLILQVLPGHLDRCVVEVTRSEDSWCLRPSIQVRGDAPGITNSVSAANRIASWLDMCAGNCHEGKGSSLCQAKLCGDPLPTRILEMTGQRLVRLLVTDPQEPVTARYACLSHCWGEHNDATNILRTTTLTLDDHRHSIPWDALPRTFKDALEVTWNLGLRYLWIDSLCIVQDDANDWRHEGSKMASTYSHSYVTIAATSSENPQGGLFSGSDSYTRAIKLLFEDDTAHRNVLYARTLPRPAQRKMPLLGRAWVLQERYLSPRVVHFGLETLTWECESLCTSEAKFDELRSWCIQKPNLKLETHALLNEQSADKGIRDSFSMELNGDDATSDEEKELSELAGEGYTNISGARAADTPFPSEHKESGAASNSDRLRIRANLTADQMLAMQKWHVIVSEYTKLQLSYESDIFPALQGIARQTYRKRRVGYFAGLWEDTLLHDLFWTCTKDRPGMSRLRYSARCMSPYAERRKAYRAPSWSWASRAGEVIWLSVENLSATVADVVSVTTTPVDRDPMGEISAGMLQLRGPCTKATVAYLANIAEFDDDPHVSFEDWNQELLLISIFEDENTGERQSIEGRKTSGGTKAARGGQTGYKFSAKYCLLLQVIEPDKNLYSRVGAVALEYDQGGGDGWSEDKSAAEIFQRSWSVSSITVV